MKPSGRNLKVIVFKACIVAIWTDSKMTPDEQRYLSHLIEVLGDNEKEREILRALRLQEVNEGLLLTEIEKLSKSEKAYVFDTCLDVLASDRRIELPELRFLGELHKACEISNRAYREKLARTRQKAKVWIFPGKAFFLLLIIILVLSGVKIYTRYFPINVDITLHETSSSKDVSVSILSAENLPESTLQTGQDVFEKVRGSIVSVNVFINNDPVCSGSGSVIGSDDSGILYVITNRHVIHNSSVEEGRRGDHVRVEIEQHSGAKFDATLDFYSREHDIAILNVKGMKEYATPLQLTLKSSLQVGQSIYAIGSPLGLDHTFTAGVISALRESYLQTDATVYYGSSGGPLVDQHGSLCAVVTKGYKTKDFSFALYSDVILEVLKERKKTMIDSSAKPEEE